MRSPRLPAASHLAGSSRLVDLLGARRRRGASGGEVSAGIVELEVAPIPIKAIIVVEEAMVVVEEAIVVVEEGSAKVGDAYLVLGVSGVGITSNPYTLVCVIACIDDLEGLSDISAVCLLLKVTEAIIEVVEAVEVAVEEVAEVVVVEGIEVVVVEAIEVADEVVVVVVLVVVSLGHGGGGGHHQGGYRQHYRQHHHLPHLLFSLSC